MNTRSILCVWYLLELSTLLLVFYLYTSYILVCVWFIQSSQILKPLRFILCWIYFYMGVVSCVSQSRNLSQNNCQVMVSFPVMEMSGDINIPRPKPRRCPLRQWCIRVATNRYVWGLFPPGDKNHYLYAFSSCVLFPTGFIWWKLSQQGLLNPPPPPAVRGRSFFPWSGKFSQNHGSCFQNNVWYTCSGLYTSRIILLPLCC